MSQRSGEREPASIIIVAPPEVSSTIARSVGYDVIAFRSLDELDRWRAGRLPRSETVFDDLTVALEELGVAFLTLPHKLRNALESIAHRASVPGARELEAQWPSRRSFYRMWSGAIPEPPGSFLRRVRAVHARRLLANGATAKQAAALAGFSSIERMRRQLAKTP